MLAALGAGALFGLGLAVSQFVNPAKVLGFLDVAGNWDPTLGLVFAAALVVTVPAFPLILRRRRPAFAPAFSVPTVNLINGRLIGGAVLFGVGWGLIGLCPGPAFASLAYGMGESFTFVVAMVGGMGLTRLLAI